MNLLRLSRLRHFCVVAERGSIGLAAHQLHITQPALTRSIRKVEEDAGEPLFERTAQGVRLTAVGRTLLPFAQAILAEADRAVHEWKSLKGERRSRLKVGISANFASYLMPDALPRFLEQYPKAHVEVQTGTLEQLLAALSSVQVDLALAVSWSSTLEASIGRMSDLMAEPLLTLPAGPYAPPGHRMAGRGPVSLEELQRENWVVPHGLSISYVFHGRFTSRGLDAPAQLLSTASIELLLQSSRRLNAITLVPRHLVQHELRAGNLAALDCPELALDYQVSLVMRRRGARTPPMTFFAQILRDLCAEVGSEDAHKAPPARHLRPVRTPR